MASLLVVRVAAGPTADDTNLINFLTGKGHTVTDVADTSALPDVGYDAIIVTDSGSSGSAAIVSIPTCLLPVMMFETTVTTALLATAAMTTNTSGTQYDLIGDPFGLNAGYPDPLTVFASSSSFYGVATSALPAGASQLAGAQGTPTHATAWVVDSGGALTSGNAPNRRAAMGLIATRLSGMVAGVDSKEWFNGVVGWLAGTGGTPAPLPVGRKSRLHHPGMRGPTNLATFYKKTRVTEVAPTGPLAVDVDPAVLVLSGVDVVAAGNGAGASVAVDPAALTLTGQDVPASGTGSASVTVDPATLTLTGQDVAATGTGAASVTVDAATLTLSGQTPTLDGTGAATATVDPAILVLTGVTPAAAGSGAAAVTVDVAILVLSGIDVTAATSGGPQSVTVDAAVLTLTGVDLALTGTGTAAVIADSATLLLTGVTPAAAGTGTATVAADSAVLTLTGVEVIAAGFVADPNPVTVTARERPSFATVTEAATATARALPAHATVTEQATTTSREASVGTIQENH